MNKLRFDQQFDRLPDELYPTLDAKNVVDAVLNHGLLVPDTTVWEPHAGRGHIMDALHARGWDVKGTDLHDHPDKVVPGFKITPGIDFLSLDEAPKGCRSIFMNPPYDTLDDHVRKACELMQKVSGTVVLLARSDWSHAKRRDGLVTPGTKFCAKIELAWRLRWIEDTTVSGRHNYSIYAWAFTGDWERLPREPRWGVYYRNQKGGAQ